MGKESVCVQDEDLRSKPDEEQLAYAAAGGYVFVTGDARIKVRKHERAALLASGVKVVELVLPQNYGLWDRFKVLVKNWELVEQMLEAEDYVVVRPNSVKSLREDTRK